MDNPQLKILSTELHGTTFPLTSDMHTVGRVEDCDICVPNDAVSSKHCELKKTESGTYKIIDLKSTNGTRVNNSTVSEAVLEHGDIIKLGSLEVLYEASNHHITSSSNGKKAGLNLRDTAGSTIMTDAPNFSPFGSEGKQAESGVVSKALGIGLAVLSLILVILVVYLILNL